MSEKSTRTVVLKRTAKTPLSKQGRQDLEEVAKLPERDIDVSDIPPLPPGWATSAKRFNQMYKARKEAISLRLDADVLQWLRSDGEGYQSRINAILRERMVTEAKR